ncbi:MAG: hypothetical protein ACYS9Y_08650 [Planctomycetota bacterium]|jgi:hypothetical protein
MAYNFEQAKDAFKNDKIRELACDSDGLRFLKLRSLSRSEHMEYLVEQSGLTSPGFRGRRLLKYLFESSIENSQIEHVINQLYQSQRTHRLENEDVLISELYKIQCFDWGGLHQNNLEKTIIDNYVKKIESYDRLCESIDNELFHSMKSYVLCSWYNHWSSIVIEDIFRDHARILPAVGLIKKIDFFINDTPFDLKVTYMPEGYIKEKRRVAGLRPELTLLKRFCRENSIHFDNLPDSRLLEDLWCKVSDYPNQTANELINELREFRLNQILTIQSSPELLIRWLYENQGTRRFDSANRFFLVLIDKDNFFDSWKLKRAKPLLADKINVHLDQLPENPGIELSFVWDGDEYNVTSDLILITHERH